MGNVGKRATVDDGGVVFQRLDKVGVNGVLQQTTTFNGTDNKIIERAVTISFTESGENQLTLFFGESGVRMDEILLVQE